MLAGIHSLFWLTMIVLYVVVLVRFNRTQTPPKLLHNLLRLSFLATAGLGIYMIVSYAQSPNYHIKGTIAVIMFGLMEMSLARVYKKKPAAVFIGLVSALLVFIILMGYGVIKFF